MNTINAWCKIFFLACAAAWGAKADQYWNVYQVAPGEYDIVAQRAKFVRVFMPADVSFLTASEKQILNKLFEVSRYMSEIYLRQLSPANPDLREQLYCKPDPNDFDHLRWEMFELHFGPWDTTERYHPFIGDQPRPPGAAFYPPDLERAEFNQWLERHPGDQEAFTSLYTLIRRHHDELTAIPYHVHYRPWLEPAAQLLEEAAALSDNPSLSTYLKLCAKALLEDDYLAADLAWMELKDTPIEVVIGPYEVYADELFGYKAAYQSFVTLIDPRDRKDVARFKKYLRAMEENLPIPHEHKNFRRQFHSPVIVANQIQGGGFNVPGTQAMAFNLPNDERVRETKGSKNVILKNVIQSKFQHVLHPLAKVILAPAQQPLLDGDYFFRHILFHELSHALGPGTLERDGHVTTVAKELKELHWTLEEAKADTMGIYNVLFMMEKGEFPVEEKDRALVTYFGTLFRMMRFGLTDAASRSAMVQYRFHLEQGGIRYHEEPKVFSIDSARLEKSIRNLLRRILLLQVEAKYSTVQAFLTHYTAEHPHIDQAMIRTALIPVDIQPMYPACIEEDENARE